VSPMSHNSRVGVPLEVPRHTGKVWVTNLSWGKKTCGVDPKEGQQRDATHDYSRDVGLAFLPTGEEKIESFIGPIGVEKGEG